VAPAGPFGTPVAVVHAGAVAKHAERSETAESGPPRPPTPFVVGLTRSGTTLLRMMLDAHRDLTIPPETHFVPALIKVARDPAASAEQMLEPLVSNRTWNDFSVDATEMVQRLRRLVPGDAAGAVRAFFEIYAGRIGKPRWGDKTPAYMLSVRRIGRTLPEARFVHLVRDGRDVALSQRARAINRQPLPPDQAARWVTRIRKARAQAHALGSRRYLEVRYEDLVRDPEPTLRRICGFVDLDWDPGMLGYHRRAAERLQEMAGELREEGDRAAQPAGYRIENHRPTTEPPDPGRLDRWRGEMDAEELAAYEGVAADMLVELGYELGGGR
jgi:hypothetical protein